MTAADYFDRLDAALAWLRPAARPDRSIVCLACGFDSDDPAEAAAHLRTHEQPSKGSQ